MESASQLRMLQETTGSEPNETAEAATGWVQRTGTGPAMEWLAAAKQAPNKLPEQRAGAAARDSLIAPHPDA